jgi:hypothetical protein
MSLKRQQIYGRGPEVGSTDRNAFERDRRRDDREDRDERTRRPYERKHETAERPYKAADAYEMDEGLRAGGVDLSFISNRSTLVQRFVMSEILGPPLGIQNHRRRMAKQIRAARKKKRRTKRDT